MAITHTAFTAAGATWATVHTTSSQSPTTNALQLLVVNTNVDEAPTASGCGLTWVEVANYSYPTTPTFRVTLFRALGTPTTGALTITNTTSCQADWAWMEYGGVDTSGTNGSGAIVQSVTGNAYNGSAPPYTNSLTLAAFGSADNATYICDGASANPSFALDTGFTLLQDSAFNYAVGTSSRLSNDTSPGIVQTLGSWVNNGLIALEIKADVVVGGGIQPLRRRMMMRNI